MFDARSILDAIIAGSSEQTRSMRENGGLGDIMGDILGKIGQPDRNGEPRLPEESEGNSPAANPLGDILGKLGGAIGSAAQNAPGNSQAQADNHSGGNPFGDILGKLGGAIQNSGGGGGAGGGAGSQSPGLGDMFGRLKDLAANNQIAAGAIIGSLGGLLLGTRTGRSIMGKAARLGGLALIGAIAYKAVKNFQSGSQADSDGAGLDNDSERGQLPELPPPGSGYEAEAMGNDDAALFIRAMVAAAAADGQIDHQEQQKIIGNLEQAGLDGEAMEFLANEFNNPASIDELAAQVSGPEQAAKVYSAARIAIEPDTQEEQEFLSRLASRLSIDSALAAQIDAAARAIKVS